MKLPAEMKTPAVRQIFAALGGDRMTRFVGGCVRNAIIGEPIGDIDLATQLLPQEVVKRLKAAGIKAVPTGIDHGTITAVVDKQGYEITTLRRDVATDGRRAVVAYTIDWVEDACRRDFTINTLLADLAGEVFDPLGQGVADLEKRRVRFVGDPASRIAEDYLRILRFFRFHARYAKGRPDPAALKECAAAARNLKSLSKERVTQEILKILEGAKCPPVFTLMQANGILKSVIRPRYEERALKSLIAQQKEPEIASRLLVLGGTTPAGLKSIAGALRLPNRMLTLMESILAAQKTLRKNDTHHVLLSLYRHGRAATVEALYLRGASAKLAGLARAADIPVLPVTGKDLLKAGYPSGPEIGRQLKKMESKWIASGFKASALPAAATSK